MKLVEHIGHVRMVKLVEQKIESGQVTETDTVNRTTECVGQGTEQKTIFMS